MIEVQSLTKRYPTAVAVSDVTFSVRQGEILGFLGPNGAGKTTTMRVLAGFLPPTSGTARVAGFDIVRQSREARASLGYLPESAALYPEMRVREYLASMTRSAAACSRKSPNGRSTTSRKVTGSARRSPALSCISLRC